MAARAVALLCDGDAKAIEASANGLAAYLELPSAFGSFMSQGEPCSVKIIHSDAAPSAEILSKVLAEAKCEVSVFKAEMAADADPAAAAAIVAAETAQLVVLVGGTPLLPKLATLLTDGETADKPTPNAVSDHLHATRFLPACGVLLHHASASKWSLEHVILQSKSWWIQGISSYEPADD